MKEIISYLYKINVLDKFMYGNYVIYKTDNSNYLYQDVSNVTFIIYINNFIEFLNQNKFFSYRFKKNIFNEIISKYNDKDFVIIDIGQNFIDIVDFDDMLSFYFDSKKVLLNNFKYKNNWNVLWQDKISYLSSHFNNNKVVNKNVELVFNYYINIAEVALQYLINSIKNYNVHNDISIVHRRIFFPNIKLYFYNPLNFIVDLEVRDISEYIKSLYYSNEDYEVELNYYIKTHNLDDYLLSLLYARIIYPSTFFDDYESNNIDINKYIHFDSYEKFIKKIYDIISSYIFIEKIDFLD